MAASQEYSTLPRTANFAVILPERGYKCTYCAWSINLRDGLQQLGRNLHLTLCFMRATQYKKPGGANNGQDRTSLC